MKTYLQYPEKDAFLGVFVLFCRNSYLSIFLLDPVFRNNYSRSVFIGHVGTDRTVRYLVGLKNSMATAQLMI